MVAPTRDYSLTGPESQRAVAAGLVDGDWYRPPVDPEVLAALNERTNLRAGVEVVAWLAILVTSAWWALKSLGSWWALPAFVVYGALYGGAADARWHECGHGTAFRTPWLNTVVYYPASFMLLREPTVWRWSHVRHHSDTIIVGRDNEIVFPRPIDVRAWLFNLVGLLGVPALIARIVRHACGRLDPDVAGYVPERDHRRVVIEARVYVVALLAVGVACVVVRSVVPALLIGLPTFYGMWLMAFFGTTQHAGLRENVLDHRLNTRTVRMNPVFRFLYLNMNYHVEHHMFPTVPYRSLPALHAAIGHDLPEPAPSTWAAYREIWSAARAQRRDPNFELERVVPSAPDGEALPLTSPTQAVEADGWVTVGDAEALAVGALVAVDVGADSYVVCRDSRGAVHALDGICTHSRQVRLADGALVGDAIECPKHNGRFRLDDGAPVREPVEVPVAVYDVEVRDGRIRFRPDR